MTAEELYKKLDEVFPNAWDWWETEDSELKGVRVIFFEVQEKDEEEV